MAYPNNKAYQAGNCALDPALYSGLLNGVTNLAQALTILDGLGGIRSHQRIDFLRATLLQEIQGMWTRTMNAAYMFGGYIGNTTFPLNGDCFDISLYAPSTGTYAIYLNAPLNADEGKLKVFIDEVQIGTAAGYDLYAAGPNYANLITITTLSAGGSLVLTGGYHRIKFRVDGLNGASSNYIVRLQKLELVRTA